MTKGWMLIALLSGAVAAGAQQTTGQGAGRGAGVRGRLPVDSPRVTGRPEGATPRAPGQGVGGLLPRDWPTPRAPGQGFDELVPMVPPSAWVPMPSQGFGGARPAVPPSWPEPAMPPMPAEPPMPPMPAEPLMPPMPAEPLMPPMPAEPPVPPTPVVPAEPPTPAFWQGQGTGSGLGQSKQQLQQLLKEKSLIDQSMQDMRFHEWDQLGQLQGQMHLMELDFEHAFDGFGLKGHTLNERMRAPWAQGDAADSLYRTAREMVNRGEYRRAAQTLRDIPQKYPNSAYASEALYWQAHALYRIGGTSDLQEALTALATLKTKYPRAKTQGELESLNTRILGVLASRGDSKAAADLRARAASDSGQTCDREDQMVKTEALNQLSRMDPENFSSMMRTVLARKDECSVPLRRNVVYIVGNKRDAGAAATLVGVAKNDPSIEVRASAIDWLARIPSDEGLATLAEFAKSSSEDERIQRAAVRALAVHPSDQARQLIRSIVERNDVPDRLRSEALGAFDKERTTVDDVAWLRSVYSKLDNRQLKQRALAAIVRVSGTESDQFLMNIVKDDNESSDLRATALRRIGQTMSVADIGKMYDAASAQTVRSSLINILGQRKENEATDKLIDIVKNGTDPNLRTQALSALTSKSNNDPRTRALLLEIINK